MGVELDLQLAVDDSSIPTLAQFLKWCSEAIEPFQENAELTIRIVDEAEGLELNSIYRHKAYATNVLSFPAEMPEGLLDIPLLGDLVICAPVVIKEAIEQHKNPEAHWAHLVTHGCLHLLGYDHEQDAEAAEMEVLEKELLMKQGYPDPYQEVN